MYENIDVTQIKNDELTILNGDTSKPFGTMNRIYINKKIYM